MSRIGKEPIEILSGIRVTIDKKNVLVEGSNGKLQYEINEGINVSQKDNFIIVTVEDENNSKLGALHGLTRALIANMIYGIKNKFEKKLEIQGVGYKAQLKGKNLDFSLGKSHPVIFKVPEGIEIKLPDQTHIEVSGISKQLVGQVAADIRALYKPEPYKGKGIRYENEYVRRKQGKAVG